MQPVLQLLLIEDDATDAGYFRELVDSWESPPVRVELEIHRSFQTAMPRLRAGDFDLLLTDYFLSGAFESRENQMVRDFLMGVVESGKRIPVAIWTSSSRLDVDPCIMKAVLNGQVHFLPKRKFNLASLRYLVHALMNEAVPVVVVGENPDLAEQVTRSIQMSEFYHFAPRVVSSVEEARQVVDAEAPDLCLVCGNGREPHLTHLYETLCARGSTLLLVDAGSGEAPARLRDWSAEHGVSLITPGLLSDPALPFQLVHSRNRVPG